MLMLQHLAPNPVNEAQIRAAYTPNYQAIFNPGSSAPLFEPAIFSTGQEFEFAIHPSRPHSSVNDFMTTINQFTTDFNTKMTQMGIDHTHFGLQPLDAVAAIPNPNQGNLIKYLQITLLPDTKLKITGTADFWECFYIEFSQYGLQLFGFPRRTVFSLDNRYYIAYNQNTPSTQAADLTNNGNFIAAQNTRDLVRSGSLPMYECCDQRMYVSVSCHLPMDSHTVVQNGVQTASRDIATAFFENTAESSLFFEENGDFDVRIHGKTFNYQTHMIKRTDTVRWHKLNSSYRLKFLRFYLHICYKLYNAATDSFILTTQDFPVEKDSFWQVFVRFVSEY